MPRDFTSQDKLQQLGTLFERLYIAPSGVFDEPWQLGRMLEHVRDRRALRDIAIKAGVSSPAVSRAEMGDASLPVTQAVAGALGYELKIVLVKREHET